MTERVCIVGAGPAGIVTAAVFDRDGFDVTVYEKFDELGGTWSSQRRYVGLAAQADTGLLEFSEQPNDTPFTEAEDVQQYLREYAHEQGVYDRIEFETEIVGLDECEDGWLVETAGEGDGEESRRFEYVVVCSGLHHVPKVPEIPGRESFEGTMVHSSEVDSRDLFEGERVVSIGFGKSALDMSVEAAEVGADTTLVFRKANWHLPKRMVLGQVPYRFLTFSRFGGSLLPRYHDEETVRLIDRVPERLKSLLWTGITKDLVRSAGLHRVDEALIPDTDLPHDIARTGVYPDGFVDAVAEGEITPHEAGVKRFDADGLHLSTGEYVPADVVVFGTGFHQTFPVLSDCDSLSLRNEDGRFAAYRSIVPPETDRIGFVGLRQTFNNFLSMEVSAHWLAAYFQAELEPMPTTAEMHEAIEERLEWQAETMPRTQGYDFGPYVIHTPEELLVDMGIDPNQAPNPLAEYFRAVKSRWYSDLHEQRIAATRGVDDTTETPGPGQSPQAVEPTD